MPKTKIKLDTKKRFKFKKYFNCWIYDQGKKKA